MCLNTVYYTKESVTKAPSVLALFTNIQPQVQQLSSLKAVTLTEAAAGQAAGISTRVRGAYMNTTVRADVGTLQAAAELYGCRMAHGVGVCVFELRSRLSEPD